MAARLELLKEQFFTNDGSDVLSGGYLYTYEVGTTTEKATYTTAAGDTAQSNPIVLDSNGRIPSDLYGVGAYKIVIKDSDGITIDTIPTVTGINYVSQTTMTDYSGDFDAAITAIGSTATTLYVESTSTMSTNVTVPATCQIVMQKGGSINQSTYSLTINGPFTCGLMQAFTGTGTVTFGDHSVDRVFPEWFGADNTGTSNSSTSLQMAATSAAGGTLYISRESTFLTDKTTISSNTTVTGGGILKAKVLASGASDPILDITGSYVKIDGVRFNGQKDSQPADGFSDSFDGGANGTGRAFRAAIKVDAVTNSNTNVEVLNCYFEDIYGACVAADNLDYVTIIGNTSLDCFHEMAFLWDNGGTGSNQDATITNNRVEDSATGDGTVQANAFGISAYTRAVVADNIANSIERCFVKVEGGNQISITGNSGTTNTTDNYPAIQFSSDVDEVSIVGNVFENFGRGIGFLEATGTQQRVSIVGNTFDGIDGTSTGDGIALDGTCEDFVIANNILHNIARHGIYLASQGSRITIQGNILYGTSGTAGTYGILIDAADGDYTDITIDNNHIENFSEDAVSNGVISITRTGSYVVDKMNFTNNRVLASTTTDRGIYWPTSGSITNSYMAGNYIVGSVNLYNISGIVFGQNTVTGTFTPYTATTGSPTLPTQGVIVLDSSGGAITATLPDGTMPGQRVQITMQGYSGATTVSVSHHVTEDPEVFTFDEVDEVLIAEWTGTEWVTIYATATT